MAEIGEVRVPAMLIVPLEADLHGADVTVRPSFDGARIEVGEPPVQVVEISVTAGKRAFDPRVLCDRIKNDPVGRRWRRAR